MKKLVTLKSLDLLNKLIDKIDGVIVGLDGFSVNMPSLFSYSDILVINDICKKNNMELFISLNKNMHNRDLDSLKELLINLDSIKVSGILYYDISIVNLKDELKLNVPLVWNQEHLTTNYLTSNFWYSYGALYTYISSELTIEEINAIALNSNAKTMTTIFGYIPMFNSYRHLVKNYLDTFNLDDNSDINYISKEGKEYMIIDSNEGTVSYSNVILNGIEDVIDIKTDYIVFNSFMINDDILLKVIELYSNVTESNVKEYKERIDSMIENDTHFLHRKTIYRVK